MQNRHIIFIALILMSVAMLVAFWSFKIRCIAPVAETILSIQTENDLENLRTEFYRRYDETCAASQCGGIGDVIKKYNKSNFTLTFGVLSCIPASYSTEWLAKLSKSFLRNSVNINNGGVLRLLKEEASVNMAQYRAIFKNNIMQISVQWEVLPILNDGHKNLKVTICGAEL